MSILTLENDNLRLRVATQGGMIVDGQYQGHPFFRPYPEAKSGAIDPMRTASFPLVPFGNRVEHNRFEFEGRPYHLQPNTDGDSHYLHGDGWLSDWQIVAQAVDRVVMQLEHKDENYCYRATQVFSLGVDGFDLKLSVENTGPRRMPFGIGHHLFFPQTDQTTLQAPARACWTEKAGHLPDQLGEIPAGLDFQTATSLPQSWTNNGFEGWPGRAVIMWPERNLNLEIRCDLVFDRYFLFRSSTDFDPGFKGDFFCFEPMSHSANGQNMPSDHGLKTLECHEVLEGTCQFRLY